MAVSCRLTTGTTECCDRFFYRLAPLDWIVKRVGSWSFLREGGGKCYHMRLAAPMWLNVPHRLASPVGATHAKFKAGGSQHLDPRPVDPLLIVEHLGLLLSAVCSFASKLLVGFESIRPFLQTGVSLKMAVKASDPLRAQISTQPDGLSFQIVSTEDLLSQQRGAGFPVNSDAW